MTEFGYLMKSEKLRFTRTRRLKKEGASLVVSVVVAAALIAAAVILFKGLTKSFISFGMDFELLSIALGVVLVYSVLSRLPNMANDLVISKSNAVLEPLPVSTRAVVTVKLLFMYIKEIIASCLLCLPLLLCYGIVKGESVGYYFAMIPVLLLLPMTSVFLSALLCYPYLWLRKKLGHIVWLTLLITIVALAFLFVVYSYVLTALRSVIEVGSVRLLMTTQNAAILNVVANILTPCNLLAYILTGQRLGLAIPLTLIAFCLFGVLSLILAIWVRERSVSRELAQRSSIRFNIKSKTSKPIFALIRSEYLGIVRSKDGLFGFVSILLILPVMTYISYSVVRTAITAYIGVEYAFPFLVMLVLLFSTLSQSSNVNTVSGEGGNIAIMKSLPFSYHRIITVKAAIPMLFLIASLALTTVAVAVGGFITPQEGIVLFASSLLVNLAAVNLSLNRELVSSKKTNSNIGVAIIQNIVIACLITAVGLVCYLAKGSALMLGMIAVMSFIVAAFSYIILFSDLSGKIERA